MAASQVCTIASWIVHLASAGNLYPGIPRFWMDLVCPIGMLKLYRSALVLTAIALIAASSPTVLQFHEFLDRLLVLFLCLAWWFPFSLAVALPHLATTMLLQCELEHVASAIESASSASDVSAVIDACQERKQR
ncbi:unnamed protein product [Symbiodinium sp. CCMP2456]|nr:unnamed protein product [Symbiodinium sp. CCMP2456]